MARVIYTNANLLDGEHAAQRDAAVAVKGERIAAVGPVATVVPTPQDEVIDLEGRTLMPGLVMGHYHATYRNYGARGGSHAASGVEQAFMAVSNVQLALQCGYTSVVSAGTHNNIDVELARAIEAGNVVGPRIVPCSRHYMAAQDDASTMENAESWVGRGPDAFREAARFDLERGAKIIKIFASGGHGAPDGMDMTRAEIEAVVDVAGEYGARVRAHVAGKEHILDCVRSGVRIIDHADDADDECIEAFLDTNCFVLPSNYVVLKAAQLGGNRFSFHEDLKDFQDKCALLPRLVAAGVKLVAGDDFGVWQLPHGTYAEEFMCYAEHAGIAPLELIKWATLHGGEMTGFPDLGTIAPGKVADLLIVNGDPSSDIGILARAENVQTVIKGGLPVHGSLPEQLVAASAG